MKKINQFILEKLKINKDIKVNKYHYHPKDKDELIDLLNKLIKERGNEADLNDIDTSKITNMSGLFLNSDFNGDISSWDVSNVTNMLLMFDDSKFDGDLSKWDVSKVTNMSSMFARSNFSGKNGDISSWDVSNVKNLNKTIFKQCPAEKNPPSWYHV